MNERRIHASIRGVVQGVGFRCFVIQTARNLGLTGHVANRYDGSVDVVAEGAEERLEALLRQLREGPRSAIVEDIAVEWSRATGEFDGFDVSF
jgi:acylphosphatase